MRGIFGEISNCREKTNFTLTPRAWSTNKTKLRCIFDPSPIFLLTKLVEILSFMVRKFFEIYFLAMYKNS